VFDDRSEATPSEVPVPKDLRLISAADDEDRISRQDQAQVEVSQVSQKPLDLSRRLIEWKTGSSRMTWPP